MKTSALAILIVYGVIVSVWKVLHILLFFYKPKRYFLSDRAPRLQGNQGPRVSILLAAKDEEEHIATCVRSVLQAEYTNFEFIVIDDRSTDRTAEKVMLAAAGDPRVQLLQIKERANGWTGKMNAVYQGMKRATGSVFLIMDADTRHTSATLGTALAMLERKKVGLLSLLPRFDHQGFFSKLVQPLVGSLVMFWKPLPWVNSSKRKQMALGWGGFLMIRRETLELVGGLESVKDRFAADIALVKRVKQVRKRVRVLHAPELVSTYLYTGARDIINGWARLLRITADNSPWLLLGTLLALWPLCLSAYPMMAVGLTEVIFGKGRELNLLLGAMGLIHLLLQLTFLGRLYRISGTNPLYTLGHLPAVLTTGYLTALALWRSRSAQMTWRGTNYQLSADGRAGAAC